MTIVDAVYDSEAVEGSMEADDFMATQMIRDAAKKSGNDELAGKNLDTIKHAMRVVLRRYGQGRKERREMMGGEVVPEAPTPPAAG